MPKSIRFDQQLEDKVERASRTLDMTHSEFIRDAVAKRCDEILGSTLHSCLGNSLGTVESAGGRATKSGRAFRQLLKAKKK